MISIHKARAAWAAALVIGVTTACTDVPLLPQWDSLWNIPLPSQSIGLLPAPIANGTSVTDSTGTLTQALDKSIGDMLDHAADTGSVILTLTKRQSLALSGTDTLYIAASAANLSNAGLRIVLPIAFAATDASVTDTVSTTLTIIHNVASSNGTLYLKLQGRVANNSGATVTPAANDSIGVKLSLLALIHTAN